MPARESRALDDGHEIRLFEGDWERLQEIAAARGLTPSAIIRASVANIISHVEYRTRRIAR